MASKKKSKDIAKRRQVKQQKKARIKKTGMKKGPEYAAPVPMPGKKERVQLFQKLENMGLAGDFHGPEHPPADGWKLSAAIIDYAGPLLEKADETAPPGDAVNRKKMILEMAILMWNLALLPRDSFAEGKKKLVERMLQLKEEEEAGKEIGGPFEVPTEEIIEEHAGAFDGISDVLATLEMMYERKRQHFAEDRRFVLHYSFGDEDEDNAPGDDEIYFVVAGIPLPGEEVLKEIASEMGTGEEERGTGHRSNSEPAEPAED